MQILCTVDIRTRELYLEDVTIAAFDHLVDDVLFVIEPIDGFQLETSTIKIAAVGPLGEPHDYEIDPSTVTVNEETGNINFIWSIPVGVTAMPLTTFKISDTKNITFAVCAEIVSGDNLVKAWHSDDGTIKVKAHLEPESGGGEDPSEEATNAQKIGQLQTDVTVMRTQIGAVAGGVPTVVDSVSDMTDTGLIYILSSDGYWYYYDGTAWTQGGVYGGAVTDTTLSISGAPADAKAVGDAVGDLRDDIETNFHINGNVKPNLVVGSFVDATNNSIGASSNFSMTAPIAVKKGQIIKLTATGYGTSVGMIATCNADNTSRTTKVRSIDNNEHTYTYTVEEDGYIVCSVKTLDGADYKLSILIDYYGLFDDVTALDTRVTGVEGALADKADADDVESLAEDIADLKDDLSESVGDLKSAFGNNFSIGINLIPTETDGKFVDASNNNVSSSDNFALLGPMPVKRGQHVVFNARGYSTVVGMICTCNADNTERQTVVRSIDGTKREYTYDVLSDGFIVLSYVKSDGYELNATIDYYSYINTLNQLEPVFAGSQNVHIVPLFNGFIDPTTNRYNASNSFKTSDSINLFKGQSINFTATGYRTNVSMINLYDTNNDTYQSVARSIDSDEQLYSYTAVADCIVRLCYFTGTTPTAVIITQQTDFTRVVNLETDVAKLQTPVAYPQLFDNILCIGDSLTVGASGNGNEILTKNYPHFLRKLTVAETTIKGHGGYSAKQVWDEYISASTDLSSFDCAVIYLGTNGGLTDTVDSDCNASDYTQNADTNTGCYGKIIGKIKGDAPNCKIFCVAGPSENIRREETMNPAVRELASYYNVGLIDIEKSVLADDGSVGSQKRYTYRPVDAIHYNRLGYMTLANMLYDSMSDFMSKHLTMYS